MSLGTTWKKRGIRPNWLPRVLGIGEDLTRSISTVPVGVHTCGHQPSRLFLKAWMSPSILTRRRPRGRAGVRIWTRGMERVAGAQGEWSERESLELGGDVAQLVELLALC